MSEGEEGQRGEGKRPRLAGGVWQDGEASPSVPASQSDAAQQHAGDDAAAATTAMAEAGAPGAETAAPEEEEVDEELAMASAFR